MSILTYPHTEIATKARRRRVPVAAESTATTLLAPFVTDRGPENTLVAIDTFADFVQLFGELDYAKPEQRQILNIGQWLSNGGRVMACRLTDVNEKSENYTPDAFKANGKQYFSVTKGSTTSTTEEFNYDDYTSNFHISVFDSTHDHKYIYNIVPSNGGSTVNANTIDVTKSFDIGDKIYRITADAKYSGSYYNNLSLRFEPKTNSKGYFDVYVDEKISNTKTFTTELFRNKTFGTFKTVSDASSYIGDISFAELDLNDLSSNSYISHDVIRLSFVSDNKNYYEYYELSKLGGENRDSNYTKYFVDQIKSHKTTNPFANLDEDNLSFTVSSNKIYYSVIGSSSAATELNDTSLALPMVVYEVNTDNIDVIDVVSPYTSEEIKNPTEIKTFLNSFTITLGGGTDMSGDFYFPTALPEDTPDGATKTNLGNKLREILKQPLETPFDCMIDCGYPDFIKNDLIDIFVPRSNDVAAQYPARDDAFLFLTNVTIKGAGTSYASEKYLEVNPTITDYTGSGYYNVSVIEHYHKVTDIYSASSGIQVIVPTTYFLAGLIPYNDYTYGPQWPTAGETRGVITNSLWVDSIPANSEKQDKYDSRANYIEKDSRNMYIMTQLTCDTDETALKFINNVRALLKMKRELTTTARHYLHEFNDTITKTNLINSLNSIASKWVMNRTLSYANVDLEDYTENAELLQEELRIILDIKFTGTIEVISVNINVD